MLFLLSILAVTSALSCDPPPVQDLNTTVDKSSEIRVSWSPSNATCVGEYKVCLLPSIGDTECYNVQNTSTEYVATGLQHCMEYNVSVVAVGDDSTESEMVSTLATTAPNPVSSIGISGTGSVIINVFWNYVFPARGRCAKWFQLSMCDSKESTANCTRLLVPVSGSIYTLPFNNTRRCHATFLNLVVLDGNQQTSDITQFVVDPRPISGPENLTVTSYNSTSFQLEWEIPPSQSECDYSIYVVYEYRGEVTSYRRYIIYDPGVTQHTADDLIPCTAINVTVGFGSNDYQLKASSTVYTTPIGDEVFRNATIQEETSSSIIVVWNTTLESNQCIGAYSVCVRKEGTLDNNCQNTTNDKSNFQVTGLEARSKYQVSVGALLGNGMLIDNITLDASTKSGTSGHHNAWFGISAILLCLVTLSM